MGGRLAWRRIRRPQAGQRTSALDVIQEEEQTLTGRALRGLVQIPGLKIYGIEDSASPRFTQKGGVIVFSLKDIPHNLAAKELAEQGGIGVRDGCHCAHLLVKRLLKIHPLRARAADLGLILFPRFTSVVLPGLVRVSLGIENDEEEVDTLIRVLGKIARQPRAWVDRLLASMHNGTPFLPQTDVQQRMNDFARAAAQRVYSQLLESGVMVNGVVMETGEGIPQGGPLSPLLANILLDDLDKELERRGHRFARYADDCNIYVRSRRAGERVMKSVRRFLDEALSLKVNERKSTVDRPWRLKFLGFSFYKRTGGVLVRVAKQALDRCRDKLRQLTRRTRSGQLADIIQQVNEYRMGWIGYFRLADTPSVFAELDEWLRRRMRQLVWKRWKRGKTRGRALVALGVPRERAGLGAAQHGPWRMAASPVVQEGLSNAYWQKQGLRSIAERYRQLRCA